MKQSRSSRLLFFLCMMALMAMIASCASYAEDATEAESGNGKGTHIVILATSDLHGNICGYSYEDNKETTNNGMARLYTYIQKVRDEEATVFLIDAGDDIQGTILTDDLANKNPADEHPVMSAMNYMGYDSMTIGNHEFNWGIPVMKKIIGQAAFPVLGANVLDQDGNYVTGHGWTIIERDGVRLAVIGVCTPNIPIWDREKEGIIDTTFTEPDEAVKKAIEEIGDQADIIVVSAHMGQDEDFDKDGETDSGQKIIEDNPEVDILQVAHKHITVDDNVNGVPVAGVRKSGREIARIDVDLDEDKTIKSISTEIVDMKSYEPSQEICEIPVVKKLHEQTVNYVQGIDENGEEMEPLGITTAKFQPENEIKGLPEGKLRDTAVIDLVLNIMLQNSDADVAATALFKDTSDLPEGPINYGNIFDIYKFDNTLTTVNVTGRELKNYMEWSAECYNQWKPGDINISFDPEYPGNRYDMFGGVEYEINLSKPKGERIENVIFRGRPLKDDQILKLAINDFRYSSGLIAQNLVEGNHDWESSNSIRDMIVEYFSKNSPVAPTFDNNWHITGVDLSEDDPRREKIIDYINKGLLSTPYDESYNLEDYDDLIAEAEANLKASI